MKCLAHKFRRVIVPLNFEWILLWWIARNEILFGHIFWIMLVGTLHAMNLFCFLYLIHSINERNKKNGGINYDGLFLICPPTYTQNFSIQHDIVLMCGEKKCKNVRQFKLKYCNKLETTKSKSDKLVGRNVNIRRYDRTTMEDIMLRIRPSTFNTFQTFLFT